MLQFPLHLTSPHMRGEKVREAQKRLAKSRFGNFHPGDVDGEYGEKTAAATRRAKLWLGFPDKDINGRYGEKLHAYLGGKELPVTYKARRALRLKRRRERQAARPLREKVLAVALTQVGVEESPAGSNRVKYSEWYGLIGPWCAMFCSWCSDKVGGKFHYAYTPYVVRDARAGVNGMRVVSYADAKPGDFVLYDWEGNGIADHIGILHHKINSTTFEAVEGNTTTTSQDNGGKVMRRTRTTNLVICFVRVER